MCVGAVRVCVCAGVQGRRVACHLAHKVTIETVEKELATNFSHFLKDAPHELEKIKAFEDFQADGWEGLNTLGKAFEEVLSTGVDKKARSIGVIHSGMGDGKSRTLQELVGLLKAHEKCKEALVGKNIIEIRITLENATMLSGGERPAYAASEDKLVKDEEKLRAVGQSLIRRIVPRLTGKRFDPTTTYDFSIATLMKKISELQANAVIVLLIDGVHNFDPKATTYEGSLVQTLFDVVQEAILVEHIRVYAVCAATVKTDDFVARGMQSTEVPKYLVAPPVLTEIPDMVRGKATHPLVQEHASYFLGLAGRHPRALAELCMVDHSVDTLSTLLNKGVDALHRHYQYTTGVTPAVVKELLRCALSRTCDVKKKVGERTLGQWASHGLMRIEDGRLHMSFLFILIILEAAGLLWNMKLDTAVSSATNSCAFEVFIARVRFLRGWAFSTEEHPYEEGVPMEKLHHGVEWCGAGPDKKAVGHAPTGVFVAPTRYGDGCPLPKPLQDSKDANSLAKIVVNGAGAPSADVFCTLKAGASEDKPEYYNEVVQAKLSSMEGSKLKMDVNTDAAAGGDVYILISLGRTVSESDRDQLQELLPATSVGIVDDTNFDTYFGPFAPPVRMTCKALASAAGTAKKKMKTTVSATA